MSQVFAIEPCYGYCSCNPVHEIKCETCGYSNNYIVTLMMLAQKLDTFPDTK